MAILNRRREREHVFFTRRPARPAAGRPACRSPSSPHGTDATGEPGQAEHERRRDPVDITLHRLSGNRVGIVLFNGKGRNRHARRHEVIETEEQLTELVPDARPFLLRRRQVARGRVEAGADVVRRRSARTPRPCRYAAACASRTTGRGAPGRPCGRLTESRSISSTTACSGQAKRSFAAQTARRRRRRRCAPGRRNTPRAVRAARLPAPRRRSRARRWSARIGDHSVGPAIACSISATSSAVRAIGPVTCSVSHAQSVGCVGHQADRRPQADHAAERRRDAQRSAEVGAFGERDHPGRERRRATAGRSAGAFRRSPTDCACGRTPR